MTYVMLVMNAETFLHIFNQNTHVKVGHDTKIRMHSCKKPECSQVKNKSMLLYKTNLISQLWA